MAPARNLFLKIWEKSENSMIFSEESSRIIHKISNIELFELGQMISTVQCHSCFKPMPEGLAFCSCGMCLRPDEATIRRIHARFQTLIVPYCFARINRSSGKQCGETQWQQDLWKAVDAKRGAKKHDKATITISRTEIRSQPMDGQKNTIRPETNSNDFGSSWN